MFLGGEKNEMFSEQASASIECVRSSFTFTTFTSREAFSSHSHARWQSEELENSFCVS